MRSPLTFLLLMQLLSFAFCCDASAQSTSLRLLNSESLQITVSASLDGFSAEIQTNLAIPMTDYSVSTIVGTAGVIVVVDEKPHRGRIQIRGPDMDEEFSWAWAQDTPPTKQDSLRELDKLYNSLTKKQKKARKDAYAKARKWIRELPETGVDAQVSKSWGNKDDSSKRIDIEVIKGKAFTGKDPEAEDDDTTVVVVDIEESPNE